MNAQEQGQTQSATSLIPVKNRRQAMDWSLALASQGVEATILHDAPTDRWVLAVQPAEMERSLATLKAYHAETRGWRWHQEIHTTGITFHWAGPCAAFQLVLLHFLVIGYFPHWRDAGVMNGAAFRHGEVWRAMTATTLHADLSHLVSNFTTGAVLLGLLFARTGAGSGFMLTLLSGTLANVIAAFVYPAPYQSLGASGAILGALGLLAGQAVVSHGQWAQGRKAMLAAIAAGAMLFLLLGSDPRSDLVVHLAGFASGMVLGILTGRWLVRTESDDRVQSVLGVASITLLSLAWLIAVLRWV